MEPLSSNESTTAVVRDAIFGGQIALHQPARGKGYRVNADALVLAAFAASRSKPARRAFDLGSGVGGVALTLLFRNAAEKVTLVEIDARAAEIAEQNLADNGWGARGEVVRGDVVAVARQRRGEADLVVCNPPYVEPGRGRTAAGESRARARSGRLLDFAAAAYAVSARRGRACFVYPAAELSTLTATLRAAGLEPKRLRAVHTNDRTPARVVLIEAVPGKPGGLVLEPPLIERLGSSYTPEMAGLLGLRRV